MQNQHQPWKTPSAHQEHLLSTFCEPSMRQGTGAQKLIGHYPHLSRYLNALDFSWDTCFPMTWIFLRLASSQIKVLFLEAHTIENSLWLYKGLLPGWKVKRSSEDHVWRGVKLFFSVFLAYIRTVSWQQISTKQLTSSWWVETNRRHQERLKTVVSMSSWIRISGLLCDLGEVTQPLWALASSSKMGIIIELISYIVRRTKWVQWQC